MVIFDGFTAPTLILLVCVLVFAGLVHGVMGIGFPLIATPLIAMMTDVRSAMLMLLIPTLAINGVNILRGGHWAESIGKFWPLAMYGAIGSLIGTRLLVVTDPAPYRLLLAGAIVLYLNTGRFGMRMEWVRKRPKLAAAAFGLVGGFLAGTVNVMLPALVIFSLELGLAPLAMVQTFNFCFLFGKLSQAAVFTAAGAFSSSTFFGSLLPMLVAVAALLVGIRFRDRIEAETYRKWLRKVLAILAAILVLQFCLGAFPEYFTSL